MILVFDFERPPDGRPSVTLGLLPGLLKVLIPFPQVDRARRGGASSDAILSMTRAARCPSWRAHQRRGVPACALG